MTSLFRIILSNQYAYLMNNRSLSLEYDD